jgi:hypothetical protein
MGYGTGSPQRAAGVSLSTLILAVVCVALAALLALTLAGRHQAAVRAAASPSPSASGTAVPPAGAPDAVAAFVGAWALAPADRDDVLASVTVTGVAETVAPATARAWATTHPSGAAAFARVDDQQYTADQPLTNGSAMRLHLVFDQAAVYGWLVSSVQSG